MVNIMEAKYKFWFYIGSQPLYGSDILNQVEEHGRIMTESFNADQTIPFQIVFKGVGTTTNKITSLCKDVNKSKTCTGLITWMHTFSPSKMWIRGLSILNKPYLHLNTQFNRNIPFQTIDMNFMNTNQSAHGDREHGFITARLRLKRKVICGYWKDKSMRARIAIWMRAAIGAQFSRDLKVARFGDNMRYVAVTEGDKVQAEKDLGWSVNTYALEDLLQKFNQIERGQIEEKLEEYQSKYHINKEDWESIKYQAKLELAILEMQKELKFLAYTDCFQDLGGLEQLPGLAVQNLMSQGIGFGAEGDWKTAALQAIMGEMSKDLGGHLSFIEDYTYHLEEGNEAVLGAHMLEISPAIAQNKPKIEVHQLSIGDKRNPARLVFEGREGPAILATIIDMGGRFRLIVHDIAAISPMEDMPKLPTARVMWKLQPDMITGNEAWIYSGGAHHSVISYDLTAEHMKDFATIMGIECIHIGKDSTLDNLQNKLLINDIIWNR
ncbi:MAG: L-arabinose isomerase [Candidatus Lokiarchaeota archaeon]|nr:L-arabinose isomerase [Candidatus Lokiarchaeota archaeon]